MERIVHALQQGTPEWDTFRLEHDGASEAASVLGLSKKVPRNELLHAKHTGLPREFSEFVQTRILDHGHKVEAMARPLVDEIIGEETYPATYSYGKLSASTDGITVGGEKMWEHKQWNAELAASVARGELPDEHQPQVQQALYVTNADKCLFVVSDGTRENFVYMWVERIGSWFHRITNGWNQFHIDLANYTPPEVVQAAVAAPIKALPAVSIKVEGAVALISNLDLFGKMLQQFIDGIPKEPKTDQEFADCKAACKALQEAQDALDAAEAHALGQVASFDEMKRTKALLWDLARKTRLLTEKVVDAQEKKIKEEIVAAGRLAFTVHLAEMNKLIGKPYMPDVPVDFVNAIKNKRTVASLKNAVDTELARAKIAASEIAGKIKINMDTLRELAKDHAFLFADTAQIVLKAADDFNVLVESRIAAHKEAERKKGEELREKIRKEEEARAAQKVIDEKAAADKLAMEQDAKPQDIPNTEQVAAPRPPMIIDRVTPTPLPPLTRIATPQVSTATEVSGIKRLTILIDEAMADMTAGELQQVLDSVRGIKAGRKAA